MSLATAILLALAAPQAPAGAVSVIADTRAAAEQPLKPHSWVELNSYNAFVATEETPAVGEMVKPAIVGRDQLPTVARGKVSPII